MTTPAAETLARLARFARGAVDELEQLEAELVDHLGDQDARLALHTLRQIEGRAARLATQLAGYGGADDGA